MAGNGPGDAVGAVLADAGADDNGSGQTNPAAHGMHHGGTGKINEAELFQPAAAFAEQAAPGPVSADRIDKGRNKRTGDQVDAEAGAFGHGSGNNGGRGRGEHGLEEPEGPQPCTARAAGTGHAEQRGAQQAARVGAEHQTEPDKEIKYAPHEKVGIVFHHDVGRVLGPGQTAFHQREAGLHEHDQHPADQGPQNVGIFLRKPVSCHGRKRHEQQTARQECRWKDFDAC